MLLPGDAKEQCGPLAKVGVYESRVSMEFWPKYDSLSHKYGQVGC